MTRRAIKKWPNGQNDKKLVAGERRALGELPHEQSHKTDAVISFHHYDQTPSNAISVHCEGNQDSIRVESLRKRNGGTP